MGKRDRKSVRAQSADFLKSVVEMTKRKEGPATPLEKIRDTQKIAELAKDLKNKNAEKSQSYWTKRSKSKS